MSDLPTSEVELKEDPTEVHKIYKQSFIDEQVNNLISLYSMGITSMDEHKSEDNIINKSKNQ